MATDLFSKYQRHSECWGEVNYRSVAEMPSSAVKSKIFVKLLHSLGRNDCWQLTPPNAADKKNITYNPERMHLGIH